MQINYAYNYENQSLTFSPKSINKYNLLNIQNDQKHWQLSQWTSDVYQKFQMTEKVPGLKKYSFMKNHDQRVHIIIYNVHDTCYAINTTKWAVL